MRKLMNTTVLLACTFMLLAVVDDAEAGRLSPLRQLRQDRLEIGRGMLEVQNVDWTTLLQYYTDDIEYHCPLVDVYGIEMVTEFLGRLYGSSPDLVTTIEDETLVGDVYSATWTMVGTFSGVPYEATNLDHLLDPGMVIPLYLTVSNLNIQLSSSYTYMPKHFLNRSDRHSSRNHATGKSVA